MCGISGIIGQRPQRDWRNWAALTQYRGPNALDTYETPEALLCHNRLSIIDLSEAANQPMISDDGRYCIVFNGEIYNFQDLMAELERLGYSFKTHSDTEVLLNGFIEWGETVLDKLDGMFAFAVWDNHAQKLFAARDHAGIKPFFYANRDGRFVFGSEIKLILKSGLVPNAIREDGIAEYLAYSYVPAPNTIYAHIKTIKPGEALWFDLRTNVLRLWSWWSLPVAAPMTLDIEQASEELEHLFSKSVKRRLVSDVPVGAFLSGGLDSSAIVSEMARLSSGRVRTFAIGYKDNPEYDESQYAEEVARHLGVDHETIYPEFPSKDLESYIDLIVNQFDQPYGNATVILTHILTGNVRNKVTVALVGDGGDELFGGYPRYWALGQQARFGWLVRLLRPSVLSVIRHFPETPKGNHTLRRIRRFFISSEADLGSAFEQSSRLFPEQSLSALVQDNLQRQAKNQTFIRDLYHAGGSGWLAQACFADQQSFLPYNLLEGADRMSMVNSFELRLPFVDRELMEFATRLPPDFRIKGNVQKRILRKTYANALPEAVLKRPKRGFNPPVWHWLQDNTPLLQRMLRKGNRLADYIRMDVVADMIKRFEANTEDNSTQLWSLLILDRWLENQG